MPSKLQGKSFAKGLAKKSKGTVTFEQLMANVIEKAPKKVEEAWSYHIEQAKELRSNYKEHRMVIAEIAIRACFIIHGGDVKSDEFKKHHSPHTLKEFARATGMQYKTLHDWIITKKRVYDYLPRDQKDGFKYATAYEIASAGKGKPPEILLKQYTEMTDPTDQSSRRRSQMFKDMRRIVFWLTNERRSTSLTEYELTEVQSHLASALARCNYLLSIHAKAKRHTRRQKQEHSVARAS